MRSKGGHASAPWQRCALGHKETGLGTRSPPGPIVSPGPAACMTPPPKKGGGRTVLDPTASGPGSMHSARCGAGHPHFLHDASVTARADIKLDGRCGAIIALLGRRGGAAGSSLSAI